MLFIISFKDYMHCLQGLFLTRGTKVSTENFHMSGPRTFATPVNQLMHFVGNNPVSQRPFCYFSLLSLLQCRAVYLMLFE